MSSTISVRNRLGLSARKGRHHRFAVRPCGSWGLSARTGAAPPGQSCGLHACGFIRPQGAALVSYTMSCHCVRFIRPQGAARFRLPFAVLMFTGYPPAQGRHCEAFQASSPFMGLSARTGAALRERRFRPFFSGFIRPHRGGTLLLRGPQSHFGVYPPARGGTV